jgi:hypothetical protein
VEPEDLFHHHLPVSFLGLISALNKMESLAPHTVIAGHKNPKNDAGPIELKFVALSDYVERLAPVGGVTIETRPA